VSAAPPIATSAPAPNVHSNVTAPCASVIVAVNACVSPTTDGPACVTSTVSAGAEAAARESIAKRRDEATAQDPNAGRLPFDRRSPLLRRERRLPLGPERVADEIGETAARQHHLVRG